MSDLLYSDIEESLRSSVRGALQRVTEPAKITRLYDDANADLTQVWEALVELGLPGLLIDEVDGGAGATAREAAVVLEELGRSVAPVPFLTSSVMAATILKEVGAREILAELAEGNKTAVLVLPWSSRPGAWTEVTDSVSNVAGAIGADYFLFPRMVDSQLQLELNHSAVVQPIISLDMSRPLARVAASGTPIILAKGEVARAAVDSGLATGASLLASEQFGLAKWCLETTLDYVKTRVQFARPIGSFQAIKHRLADLFVEVTQSQAAARYAADTLAISDPDAAIARATAQAYCSNVAVNAAETALQLHGGIGMTWEHAIHIYLKRAKSDQIALGTPAQHRTDLSKLVDLPLK